MNYELGLSCAWSCIVNMLAAEKHWEKNNLPLAIYEGFLQIGDVTLDVAVLEDDKRIISSKSVFEALNRPSRPSRPSRGSRGASIIEDEQEIKPPAFMDAVNLKPYLNQDVIDVIKRVKYRSKDNQIKEGYDATILPIVCDVYLKSREDKALKKAQFETAHKAEVLVRSLAKVGIVALVDGGYRLSRHKRKGRIS
ncbi:hypothetical protein [Chelonobacter oris]|uniref:hypothetical protein n=1 Tax=Chelonobacter oris TaxID=505317 RepID=UPI00244B9F68|nr:hypothetical protein [Chelonobacter oris]